MAILNYMELFAVLFFLTWLTNALIIVSNLIRVLNLVSVVYQVQLMSTWGDDFYIGLNGIEMYDEFGKQMKIDIHNLAAYPESVNVLRHVNNDPRTSAKLIDRCNDTSDAHHMWLAPVMHNDMNRIFIVFDQPTSVSRMRIWNYRKTPERGARDMTVLVDDTMIFSGELPQSQLNSTGYCDIQTLSECF